MTSTIDFADVLALPNGASFVRGDLHIHSVVGSHDVTDAQATPEKIVQTAIDSGLSVIAIADHNEITAVEAALSYAAGKPLLVVPAVELSTMQGHLLCYAPDLRSLQQFYAQLSVRDSGNANSRVENSMIDCLNKLEAHGGFAILAHVDGPKGLEREMPGASPHKLDILSHATLVGIELKSASSDVSYTSKDPDGIRAGIGRNREGRVGSATNCLARVLNSDSHTLTALGRNAAGDQRVTRYKLQVLSFDALRLALTDPEARVRLEDESIIHQASLVSKYISPETERKTAVCLQSEFFKAAINEAEHLVARHIFDVGHAKNLLQPCNQLHCEEAGSFG